jgi:hypothetical protein
VRRLFLSRNIIEVPRNESALYDALMMRRG